MARSNTSTRTGSSGSSRANASARNEIIAMLKDDHKRVKKAFRDFEKLDPQEDAQSCQTLVERTCAELEVHAELEEQLFYPAARAVIKEEDLIDEAEVEHSTVKMLIEQLKGMGPADEKFAATFKVLGEYVQHHIKEEEGEMFKQLGRAGSVWATVLEEMMSSREHLKEEKGLTAMEADVAESGASQGRSSGGGASDSASGARRVGSRSAGTAESRPQASDSEEEDE